MTRLLKLYIGRAGTGKTTRIYEELSALAEQQPEVLPVLLVPEQFSFETERALLVRMGPEKASRVRVLSFTRLAETVAKEVGGLAGRRVTDASRTLLLSQALETVADHLVLYRKQINSGAFVETLLRLLSECKQCTVTPAQLTEVGAALGDGVLGQKARELSLIFEAYETLLAGGYTDPLDNLTILARQLPQASLLKGAPVFIDGFKGFTPQQLLVLRQMLPLAGSVTVALCTPTLQDDNGGFGLFSPVIRTANRLYRLAEEAGITRGAPVHFTENYRSQTTALRQLESEVFSPLPVPVDDCKGVYLAPCDDVYAECAFVARELRGQLQAGRRARNLAVVMRDPTAYRGILDVALRREGVPFYMDERENILSEPLSALILTAVRIAVEGFRTDRLLPLMKTGLCGFSAHSAALLENYAYLWNINSARWEQEWTMNPAGLTVKADDNTDRRLWYLNLLRSRLIRPLSALRRALREPLTGEEFARSVWRYLSDVRVGLLFTTQVRALKAANEWENAERQSQLWGIWTELLDTVATAPGTAKLPAKRLCELLQQMVTATDIGTLPAGLDGVQVGAVDRVRLVSPETVFLMGVNEGVFPAYPPSDGLFTDRERRELIRLGLPMAEPADGQALEERFFAYTALSAPSQELHISWICGNSAGEAQSPSSLVSTVRQILPLLEETPCRLPDSRELRSAGEAMERLAASWQHPTVTTATLHTALTQLPSQRAALAQIEASGDKTPAMFRDPAAARGLFGNDLRLSPSQVDAFYQCRFSYFCRYGLRVQPPRPAELGAAEFGTLAHALMERALPTYVEEGVHTISRERVNADAKQILHTYVEEEMGGADDKGIRFAELLAKLTDTAAELLWHVIEELRQSRFVPTDFELPIGLGEEGLPATVLQLPDGSRIRVRGVVDRVDVYHRDGTAYVRVVDYKTGSKKFRLSDVVEGLNLQMLIYLFTIWENGGPRYGSMSPAGVLYLPATLPVISAERDISEEQLHTEQLRSMKMSGLLLDDPEIIQAMEADANGIFIPAKLNKQGQADARSSEVASLGRLGRLKKRVEALLLQMAETLRRGDIAAVPLAGSRDACEWCGYRAVCRHEAEDPVKFLIDRPSDKVWASLEDEENENAEIF